MNAASLPLKRLLPSTMFGRLAAALVIVVGVMLAVIVALNILWQGWHVMSSSIPFSKAVSRSATPLRNLLSRYARKRRSGRG